MGLNLNSLKNLPSRGTLESSQEESIPTVTTDSQMKVTSAQDNWTTSEPDVTKEKIALPSVSGPKISLMKLKKASEMESTTLAPIEAMSKEEKSVAEIEKELLALESQPVISTTNNAVESTSIDIPSGDMTVTETPSLTEDTPVLADIQEMSESLSIMDTGTSDAEKAKEKLPLTQEEPKEFFPNFQITDTLKFDDDLIDLEDLITIKEHKETETEIIDTPLVLSTTDNTANETIPEKELLPVAIIENTPPADTTEEEIIVLSPIESVPTEHTEISSEALKNTTNTVSVTPEYVAEIKTELSEQRRGGFRFFAQNKTKIIAGLGVVFSLSAVVFFSNSFMLTDIENVGKSNVQEGYTDVAVPHETPHEEPKNNPTVEPIASPVENPANVTQPVITTPETPDYEIGKDYSVTKNTKKNVRSKMLPDTASGKEVPTP